MRLSGGEVGEHHRMDADSGLASVKGASESLDVTKERGRYLEPFSRHTM